MNKDYKTFEELKEELGDKFEEFMYKANIELLDKVNQLETNRDEAIEFIKNKTSENNKNEHFRQECIIALTPILEILERGKE